MSQRKKNNSRKQTVSVLMNPVLYAPSSSIRGQRAESIITNSVEGDRDSSRSTDMD